MFFLVYPHSKLWGISINKIRQRFHDFAQKYGDKVYSGLGDVLTADVSKYVVAGVASIAMGVSYGCASNSRVNDVESIVINQNAKIKKIERAVIGNDAYDSAKTADKGQVDLDKELDKKRQQEKNDLETRANMTKTDIKVAKFEAINQGRMLPFEDDTLGNFVKQPYRFQDANGKWRACEGLFAYQKREGPIVTGISAEPSYISEIKAGTVSWKAYSEVTDKIATEKKAKEDAKTREKTAADAEAKKKTNALDSYSKTEKELEGKLIDLSKDVNGNAGAIADINKTLETLRAAKKNLQ
ncbi:hypothetical protein HYW76_04230 [Candidatus Pacearchaeota archaeon]|nr:hypothetical protein [Candidatus Pacearchaeota archaeon]